MGTVKLETVKNWKNVIDPAGEWLQFETQGNNVILIKCSLCTKFADKLKMKRNFSPAFINGISGASLKKDNVFKHCRSDMHILASNLELKPNSLKKVMEETVIGKAITKASSEEQEKIKKLIEIAYLIAKKELPFALFPDIAKMEKRHGVNLGDTYLTDKKCQEFTGCIADTLKEDLRKEIKDVRYISVMTDESTDISVNQKLLIYIRFVGSDGVVKNKFTALRNLGNASAAGILNILLEILPDYGIDDISQKLVGFCSDGASVNFGVRNGLIALIKQTCPWLIAVHCFNHRLELAVKDSMAKTYFEKVISVMQFLYSFYKRSPKRKQQIADLAEILDEENCKNYSPANVQGTRWIDFKRRAAVALLNSYALIVSHLENIIQDDNEVSVDKSKISSYLNILKSKTFVFYLLLMNKVCSSLAKLSLNLQEDSCNLLNAKIYLEQFEIFVEKVKCEDEQIDENLMTVLKSGEFCNIKLNETCVDVHSAYTYLKSLAAKLREWFSDLSSDIIKCLKILDSSIWPLEKEPLFQFGNQEIKHLQEVFSVILKKNNVNATLIIDEWNELKSFWLQNWQHLSSNSIWSLVLKSKRDLFPNLSHLFEILLILPSLNAVVERCFSYMPRIKTDYRSRMTEDVLENLIRISVDGPDIEQFSPIPSVQNFFSKPRRPNICPYGKRKKDSNDDVLE